MLIVVGPVRRGYLVFGFGTCFGMVELQAKIELLSEKHFQGR